MRHTDIHPYLEPKKTKRADLQEYRPMFLSLGLTTSLLIVIASFEIKQTVSQESTQLVNTQNNTEEILEIPPTDIPPPPPSLQLPQIVEVPNEADIIEEVQVNFDIEINADTKVQEITINESPVVEDDSEKADEIFLIVEESAAPRDGMNAFYKLTGESIRYPAQARRLNVEGKVFVEFVVNKDGELTDIHVIKGIGSGCDEEAIRVVKLSPPWVPAKQRGKPVRQRIVLPIFFKLKQL